MRMSNKIMNLVSQEEIAFQADTFFKDLTLGFKELCASPEDELEGGSSLKQLNSVVKHHTGITVNFYIDKESDYIAAHVPMIDGNNVLVNSFDRLDWESTGGLKLIENCKDVLKGTVNLKTSKVTGVFEKVSTDIMLSLEILLDKKILPEEHAAIALHEVGHLFTYFEFMTRSVTTNQVLSGISKALDNSSTVEEREAVFITVKKAIGLSDLDAKKLAQTTNKKVAEIVVITNMAKESRSELGVNIYDNTSWEYLCDQFAARHGGGRYLATFLDKTRNSGLIDINSRSFPAYLFMECFKLMSVIVNPVYGAMLAMVLVIYDLDDYNSKGYDTPEARVKRIRNQIVEKLKDTKINKKYHKSLSDDLLCIDDVLSNMSDKKQWCAIVSRTIIPSFRKAYQQEQLQKDLEAIAANELFVKSAALRQLATI